MRKIISFIHLSPGGFAADPNGEMHRIKIDEEIFDHVGKRISEVSLSLPIAIGTGAGRKWIDNDYI